MQADVLGDFITQSIQDQVAGSGTATGYRRPLVGFAPASDPRFRDLQRIVEPTHFLPDDMLPGARTVVAFFLPFAVWVVEANSQEPSRVAREWSQAYVETNALIGRITDNLVQGLASRGVRAAAAPATHNFDPITLVCRWSHKSAAVIAGLGSFGLHHMVITDAGCAGRFGSLVIDAGLPTVPAPARERCRYFYDGSCHECVDACPVGALSVDGSIDKHRCNNRLLALARGSGTEPPADACGKCAVGPCALGSGVM